MGPNSICLRCTGCRNTADHARYAVTDNLFSQGSINQNLVAISFEPTQTAGNSNGELTFGATDRSKFVGAINFAYVVSLRVLCHTQRSPVHLMYCSPITSTFPSAEFFGIDQSLRYGPSTFLLSNSAGIVDTGTTLLLIASGKDPHLEDYPVFQLLISV